LPLSVVSRDIKNQPQFPRQPFGAGTNPPTTRPPITNKHLSGKVFPLAGIRPATASMNLSLPGIRFKPGEIIQILAAKADFMSFKIEGIPPQ
jgi:hypothetical protein